MHPLIFYRNFKKRQKLFQSFQLSPSDLVLDIGSGQNPNPRANVLCDRFLQDTTERNQQPLTIDRPLVLGDATNLPFKDKSFDFVICSHLLEHVENPEIVLKELERIGKRGYIETPSSVWEKLHSFPFHRWYVSQDENQMIFSPKSKIIHDSELKKWVSTNPKMSTFISDRFEDLGLLMQYHWHDKIHFKIENGAKPINFSKSDDFVKNQEDEILPKIENSKISLGLKAIRFWGEKLRSQSDVRVSSFNDLLDLCHCVKCKSELQVANSQTIVCKECKKTYLVQEIQDRLIPNIIG